MTRLERQPDTFDFLQQVERAYAQLMQIHGITAETCLGGKFFYADALDFEGRTLTIAANISGAATLIASDNRNAQKQAMRDGVVDFVVTTLDESLRILKNELRKHEPVAVCAGQSVEAVALEMEQRGVLPDLLRSSFDWDAGGNDGQASVHWKVETTPAQWLPRIDALALECIETSAWREQRWLKLAPRYLGRLANEWRMLRCGKATAIQILDRIASAIERREIEAEMHVELEIDGKREARRLISGKH